jgi:hypothetical protein
MIVVEGISFQELVKEQNSLVDIGMNINCIEQYVDY